MRKKAKIYRGLAYLPDGRTSGRVTEGCIVLEGGAWRGLYTQGALDALMQEDITFRTTIGVSAGAMAGIGYVAGQIGLTARINLSYRSDPNYVGTGAMLKDHGITGFSYLFGEIIKTTHPLDRERFFDPKRRLIAVATNMITGAPAYFEKGKCRIFKAIQASATVPYISRPVVIDGVPYLDGGCSSHIPYVWAKKHFPGKIVVIRTRDKAYRTEPKKIKPADLLLYGRYPAFLRGMIQAENEYNATLDLLDEEEKKGTVFVLAPKRPITISHFESDLDILGGLYWQGYKEMKKQMPALRAYLA